jgi:phospho-N-acetylmuramoyl-pentapeptide-transferase
MSEIGYNALSFSLVIIAFMTNTVFLLPIIALILFLNLVATVLQVLTIRLFGFRIFKVVPLHHHFEVKG